MNDEWKRNIWVQKSLMVSGVYPFEGLAVMSGAIRLFTKAHSISRDRLWLRRAAEEIPGRENGPRH